MLLSIFLIFKLLPTFQSPEPNLTLYFLQGFRHLQSRFPRHLECDKEAFVRAVAELKASGESLLPRAPHHPFLVSIK